MNIHKKCNDSKNLNLLICGWKMDKLEKKLIQDFRGNNAQNRNSNRISFVNHSNHFKSFNTVLCLQNHILFLLNFYKYKFIKIVVEDCLQIKIFCIIFYLNNKKRNKQTNEMEKKQATVFAFHTRM